MQKWTFINTFVSGVRVHSGDVSLVGETNRLASWRDKAIREAIFGHGRSGWSEARKGKGGYIEGMSERSAIHT